MTAKQLLVAITVALLTQVSAPFASEPIAPSEPSIDLRQVRTLFRVVMEIQAGYTALVIPVCGTDDPVLCSAHLEVLSPDGWVAAPTPRDGPILGGYPLDRAKAAVVQPHSSTRFVFQFAKHVFELRDGQQLRVVVDGWPDEVAMRKGDPKIRIEGPAFELP